MPLHIRRFAIGIDGGCIRTRILGLVPVRVCVISSLACYNFCSSSSLLVKGIPSLGVSGRIGY
jgi:non-canonical (house-cleaning) NTP pyrophosphatase